jgi:hypothetical protein
MPKRVLFFLCAAALAFAADEWVKVKELKTGVDLRVYKSGAAQPLLVKMGELTDDNLVVIDKNKETAIPRDHIERIDARPSGKRAVTRETTTTEKNAATDPRSTIPGPNSPPGTGGGTSTSTSSGLSWGSKPDFETIYKRPAAAPKKQ